MQRICNFAGAGTPLKTSTPEKLAATFSSFVREKTEI